MTRRGQGDDPPGDSGTGAAVPARVVVRSDPGSSGADSTMVGAADTAVAAAASHATSPGEATLAPAALLSQASAPAPAPASGAQENLVGITLLGRYAVTRKIGQGGMGAVYEATHTLIGKRVAVKVLLDKYARKEQVVARLEQEARLASSIGHEHIIDITDFGQTDDGRTFVVMEFLEGESLAELLAREGPLPEARIVDIAYQVASALSAAHAKGIVHRDVKPENVFLLRRKDKDFVKVVDFGISKSLRASDAGEDDSPRLTQTGMVLGTPLYMSPEQARGDDELDHRIDVYAVGVIMYELATGRVPFTGANYLSIISQVLNDAPPSPRSIRPELSDELEAVIARAMAKDRADRYQGTTELIADLATLAGDPTHSTQRPRIVAPGRRARRSGLRLVAWIGVVAGIVAAVALTVNATMGGGAKSMAALAPDAAPPAPPVDAASPALPALPAVQVVKVRIETLPPGATLYEGGVILGRAPLDAELTLSGETIKVVAELAGYDDAECNIRPAVHAGKTVQCKLDKVKKGQERRVIKRDPDGASGARPPAVRPKGPTAGGDWSEGSPFNPDGTPK